LYRVPGFLENVNISVANDYPWEINLEKSQAGDVAQLPQVIDIAVSFKPIFDILPRRATVNVVNSDVVSTAKSPIQGNDVQVTQNVTSTITNNPALIANVPFKSRETAFIDPGDVTTKINSTKPLPASRTVGASVVTQRANNNNEL